VLSLKQTFEPPSSKAEAGFTTYEELGTGFCILRSAFIELKSGGEVRGLLRSNPQISVDAETGEILFDQDFLSENSFAKEFLVMAELTMFFNRCYIQLIHRLPTA
jgi:hypothetical protein